MAGKQTCLPHTRLHATRQLTYVTSVNPHTKPGRGHYHHTLTQQTRMPLLQELCVFPKAPELKDDEARNLRLLLSHFALSTRVIPPRLLCQPASLLGGRRWACLFFSVPLLGLQVEPSLHGQYPLASGFWPMAPSAVQQAGLEARAGLAHTRLSCGSYTSSGRPGDPDKCEKGEGLCQGCPAQNSSMQRPSALCSRSGNPVTRMGFHLALHSRSGAGSLHRVLPL